MKRKILLLCMVFGLGAIQNIHAQESLPRETIIDVIAGVLVTKNICSDYYSLRSDYMEKVIDAFREMARNSNYEISEGDINMKYDEKYQKASKIGFEEWCKYKKADYINGGQGYVFGE